MSRKGALGRGVRVGLVMAGPGLAWGALALAIAGVCLVTGDFEYARRDLRYGGLLLGGSLAAGVLMGLIIGGGLVLASLVVTRTRGLVLVGTLLGGAAFVAEILVVTAGSDGGYAEIGTALLAWPGMTAVAAVHSTDIAGVSRKRAWLWSR